MIAMVCMALACYGQENATTPPTPPASKLVAPAILPGNGLAQHDFFYAGENKSQNMYIVRKGQIVWRYEVSDGRGEISDAMLLSDGSVLFAHQFGVTLIASDKKVLWHYDAPDGTEVHTAQMIGKEHVLFVQNGNPAQVFVVNIVTGKTVRQFTLPVKFPGSTHTQFRRARLTDAGTLLVAHWDLGKVCEYDESGKELNSWDAPGAWSAEKLKNGNVLFCAARLVREIDAKGRTVWEFGPGELPDYEVKEFQIATRLPNGNTLVNNWLNPWQESPTPETASVQFWELTPQKEIVWALRSWSDPVNLGPATVIQVLDVPSVPEGVHFGSIGAEISKLNLNAFKLVWQDEFDGDRVDPKKWEVPEMVRQGTSRWSKSMVAVRDGKLHLLARRREGDPVIGYDCGAVRTRKNYDPNQTMFQQRYGYFEARCKQPKNMNADYWAAFWMMCGKVGDDQPDTRQGLEVDIFESFHEFGKERTALTFHWNGYGAKHNADSAVCKKAPQLLDGDFHAYGMYWDEHLYVLFIDGVEVGRTDLIGLGQDTNGKTKSQGPCQQPGYVKLSVEAAPWAGKQSTWDKVQPEEDELVVDYVRVYTGTLPANEVNGVEKQK
ncbi:hypothetical protein BH11VER1_BH11VER1_07460 [soil metagenome]